jgi:hypothetical protein
MFGVHQSSGGTISFCLASMEDNENLLNIQKEGLVMNNRAGSEVVVEEGLVDLQDFTMPDLASELLNVLELDPREWHEFWVTIEKADETTDGTHAVSIYMDGETEAHSFIVTAAEVNLDYGYSYLAIGFGSTPQAGAVDVDFFGYKEGIHIIKQVFVTKGKDMDKEFELSEDVKQFRTFLVLYYFYPSWLYFKNYQSKS